MTKAIPGPCDWTKMVRKFTPEPHNRTESILKFKTYGYSDAQIALCCHTTVDDVRKVLGTMQAPP